MESLKYVGLDVRRDTILAVVPEESGKMVRQTILATQSGVDARFAGAARRVARVVVRDPRQNALLKAGRQERPH